MEHNLVVRNTFIDAVVADDEDAYEAPERTRSDPTGGRSKAVMPLGRIPDKLMPITVREGTSAEEAGEEEPAGAQGRGDLCGIVEDLEEEDDEPAEGEDEEEDEDDDGGLLRTKSTSYPQGYASFGGMPAGLGRGQGGAVTTMALNRLLPEEDENSRLDQGGMSSDALGPYAGMGTGPGGFAPWGFTSPYDMFGGYGSMYPYSPYTQAVDQIAPEGQEESAPSDWRPPLPALGAGAPLGMLHSFHQETRDMGQVSPDFRMFTKAGYEGRLSVVSESRVNVGGLQRYLVQFTAGELSRADGVGFVFSPRLPCAKNIQRIVSIFVNQRGRICMRVFADIVRASAYVKPLELGDWVEMAVDLDKQVATFNIWARTPTGWPPLAGRPASTAEFPFGNKLAKLNQDSGSQHGGRGGGKARSEAQAKPVKLNVGHLACVVKNVGVTVTLGS